jgi:hypothetical protein
MNLLLILISVLVITGYLLTIEIMIGVKPRISQTYYEFKKKNRKVFTGVMFAAGSPIVLLGAYNLHMSFASICLMLAGVSLMLVGIAPAFRYNKFEEIIHCVSAFGAVAFGYSALLIYSLDFLPLVIASALVCFILEKKKPVNYVWTCEVIAFYTIYTGLVFVFS